MATQTDYPRSISVSKLTDRDVLDYDGHKIGDLDEIVLDMSSGCVDFAIVSFGGFLGIGEKHYIIPRQALHFDPEQGMFRMDVTREQVEQAPGFTRGNWPNYNDDSYMQPVFNYWGATRQQASWQRPWDPQYRKQHPEMYGQGTGMAEHADRVRPDLRRADRGRGVRWSGRERARGRVPRFGPRLHQRGEHRPGQLVRRRIRWSLQWARAPRERVVRAPEHGLPRVAGPKQYGERSGWAGGLRGSASRATARPTRFDFASVALR